MTATTLQNLTVPEGDLTAFCKRCRVARLSLFGSVTREDFDDHSDVDVLVEFEPGCAPGLLAKAAMRGELSDMLGRAVDLRVPAELSRHFRQRVLEEADVCYVCG